MLPKDEIKWALWTRSVRSSPAALLAVPLHRRFSLSHVCARALGDAARRQQAGPTDEGQVGARLQPLTGRREGREPVGWVRCAQPGTRDRLAPCLSPPRPSPSCSLPARPHPLLPAPALGDALGSPRRGAPSSPPCPPSRLHRRAPLPLPPLVLEADPLLPSFAPRQRRPQLPGLHRPEEDGGAPRV